MYSYINIIRICALSTCFISDIQTQTYSIMHRWADYWYSSQLSVPREQRITSAKVPETTIPSR